MTEAALPTKRDSLGRRLFDWSLEGVRLIESRHPDVQLYVATVDDHLNEHGFIVPGLGDAGDRIFGTQ